MKRIFVLIILLSFFALGKAQVKRDYNRSQDSAINKSKKNNGRQLIKELNLSKEQKGQLKELHQEMKQKKEEIDNDKSLTDAQKQEKLKEYRKDQKEKLNSILTPDQKEKLLEQKKMRK